MMELKPLFRPWDPSQSSNKLGLELYGSDNSSNLMLSLVDKWPSTDKYVNSHHRTASNFTNVTIPAYGIRGKLSIPSPVSQNSQDSLPERIDPLNESTVDVVSTGGNDRFSYPDTLSMTSSAPGSSGPSSLTSNWPYSNVHTAAPDLTNYPSSSLSNRSSMLSSSNTSNNFSNSTNPLSEAPTGLTSNVKPILDSSSCSSSSSSLRRPVTFKSSPQPLSRSFDSSSRSSSSCSSSAETRLINSRIAAVSAAAQLLPYELFPFSTRQQPNTAPGSVLSSMSSSLPPPPLPPLPPPPPPVPTHSLLSPGTNSTNVLHPLSSVSSASSMAAMAVSPVSNHPFANPLTAQFAAAAQFARSSAAAAAAAAVAAGSVNPGLRSHLSGFGTFNDFLSDYDKQGAPKKVRPKKFSCEYCENSFSNNGQLKGHLRIHTGERPFVCEFKNCGRSFTRNEELTRHKRIHSGLKPFKCQVCQKRFGRKDHLKKHMRTHQRAAIQQQLHLPFMAALATFPVNFG